MAKKCVESVLAGEEGKIGVWSEMAMRERGSDIKTGFKLIPYL